MTTAEDTKLTHSQMQIWMGQQLSRDSPLYNMAFAWVFQVEMRVDLFQQAWQRVAEGSDALRTYILEHEGVGLRRIRSPGLCVTEVLDAPWSLDAPWEGGSKAAFRAWCNARCSQLLPLDGQLVDSVLVRLGDGKTGWYLNLHHLITDAWSTMLLYRQVAAEYAVLIADDDGPVDAPSRSVRPEPLCDYYPVVAALTAKTASAKTAARSAALRHWTSRLQQPGRGIPLYGRRAQPQSTASTRLTLHLDEERSRAIDGLCSEAGFASLSTEMSRFAIFATLLLSWLHRISGRADLGFDAPVSGRPSAEAKRALGVFIEMFPFAASVAPDETFRSLGAKCLAEAGLFLCHALPGTSSPSGSLASNVVLNYFPLAFGDFAGLPAEVEWVHSGHGDTVHALRLQVHDFGGTGRITLHFDFNDQALEDRLRRRSLSHFERVLSAMLDDPDASIASVDVLTDDERGAMCRLNETSREPLPDRTVVALFEAQTKAHPQRIALRQGPDATSKTREMSFGQLRAQSEALAAKLVEHGVEPGDRVAILCRRSIEAVVAILGTLRAGAAYIPIDPAYPRQRIESILQDCAPRLLLIGEGQQLADTPKIDASPTLRIAEMIGEMSDEMTGDGPSTILDRQPPGLDDLAYVLYTSGSTGRPKGVLVEHRGVADYLTWAARQYVRDDRLSFALFTSLAFDLTVTSLFLPLISGGLLEIYPEPKGPVDSSLMDVIGADAVDFIKLTPSHLSLLRQMETRPSRLRRMVVGGEDFKTHLASGVAAQLGDGVEIYNEYGPTEAIVGCVVHRYDPGSDTHTDTEVSVPIGAPADHVQIAVLNHALSPVPEGVPGELWISRHGLARGYLGLEELTAQRFLAAAQAPGLLQAPGLGERCYRTGDRVRMLDAGKLEYLGRLDRQLKISGFRVEPAEIEAALLDLPKIAQCAVVAHRPQAAPPQTDDEIRYCVRCGLPSNHPRATFDRQGVCGVCRSYEAVKEHAQSYFKTMDQLKELFDQSTHDASSYDCMMLLSGGKDSTYALSRLVEMGLSVYAFTLDNGFISEGAKENVRRVAEQLGVPVEFATTKAMNAIFRDSLQRFANVCQGCFKTIYTLSTQRAKQLGIPIIVTGLSRGQMFETRLTEEMFRDGRRSPEEVDDAVMAARKVYHRLDDQVSRSLDVQIFQDDQVFEQIQFVDFYRYCDVGLSEVLAHLKQKLPWARPQDTGRSTNCLINDVGIHVHKQQRGYHNYALPYSWDVRLGHKTREEAHAELHDEIDLGYVRRTLGDIGCDVESMLADRHQPRLAAFYVASEEVSEDEIRQQLGERLPTPLIPAHFHRVEAIPLTVQGKVDEQALPAIELEHLVATEYRAAVGPVEEYLAVVWQEQLGAERIGADDNFFQLGGTSLGAMEVMIRLCREFDLDLPLETLFAHPTLGGLAAVAEERIFADVAELSDADQERLLAEAEGLD